MLLILLVEEPEIDSFAWVNPDGKLNVKGHAEIQDGASNTVLVAENRGANATCDAADDGGRELVELTIPFRFERSSERVLATITPRDGNISESGDHPAVLEFEDGRLGSFELTLTVDFEFQPGRRGGAPTR